MEVHTERGLLRLVASTCLAAAAACGTAAWFTWKHGGADSLSTGVTLVFVLVVALVEYFRLAPEFDIETPRVVLLDHGIWFRPLGVEEYDRLHWDEVVGLVHHPRSRAVTLRTRREEGEDPVVDLEFLRRDWDTDLPRLQTWLESRRGRAFLGAGPPPELVAFLTRPRRIQLAASGENLL